MWWATFTKTTRRSLFKRLPVSTQKTGDVTKRNVWIICSVPLIGVGEPNICEILFGHKAWMPVLLWVPSAFNSFFPCVNILNSYSAQILSVHRAIFFLVLFSCAGTTSSVGLYVCGIPRNLHTFSIGELQLRYSLVSICSWTKNTERHSERLFTPRVRKMSGWVSMGIFTSVTALWTWRIRWAMRWCEKGWRSCTFVVILQSDIALRSSFCTEIGSSSSLVASEYCQFAYHVPRLVSCNCTSAF